MGSSCTASRPVETRVNAAYVATYIWDYLYRGINNSHDRVAGMSSNERRRSEHVFSSLQARRSRADRESYAYLRVDSSTNAVLPRIRSGCSQYGNVL